MTADGRTTNRLVIRRAEPGDVTGIGDVWLSSWRATFDFPPGHPDEDVRRWLAEQLVPSSETWVAVDPAADGRVVGLMALSESMIEQLYIAPDWIGHGLGRRFVALARDRRPNGLDLYCFAVNARARRFYESLGFTAIAFGDGSGNEERQPDVRYAWRPTATPTRTIDSPDGTAIAVFTSGTGPPLILVHGASSDHTTFRVVAPLLAERFTIHSLDRRGRGASGDTEPHAIEREFEDVAAVASVVADEAGRSVDAFGHSYGGRCVLGAARLTSALRRVVSYEGAPTPPGERYGDADVLAELRALKAAGDGGMLLATFMTRVVGLDEDGLARYRTDPVWPMRVAAAPTIVRELAVESSDAGGLDTLAGIRQPVLQLLGGESRPEFGAATRALDERLADGRIVVIEGARHAAHHTHPAQVLAAVTAFLTPP